ncbi:MAG: FecR domain-containing protein [Verrucomicrobiota bacterium]
MKLIGNFTGKLFACVTALALASFVVDVQAQTVKEGTAKVRSIRGSAKYSLGGGVWVPLRVGTTLRPGATIQTAPESIVDLYLGENGPVVRVTPNTTVGMEKLTYAGTGVDSVTETRLNLQSGTIIGNVKKLAKASKYEIKTPNGVAGIRGTDYVVTSKKLPDGSFEVTFTSVTGTLVVAANVNGNPQTVVLNNGESWTPGSNVTPTSAQLLDFYREQVAQSMKQTLPPGYEHAALPGKRAIELHVSPTIGAPKPDEGFDQ